MKTITLKTSRIWLKKIGLVPQSRKKGIYFDGHEREDVLEYRAKFLEEMKTFEQFFKSIQTFLLISNYIYLLHMMNAYFMQMMIVQ